jgi:hypothetical protein
LKKAHSSFPFVFHQSTARFSNDKHAPFLLCHAYETFQNSFHPRRHDVGGLRCVCFQCFAATARELHM